MTDSKFYSFLSSLSKKEIARFRKYLESPYFNVSQSILDLFGIFETHWLSGSREPIEKEEVWSQLYPNEIFDYEKLRKVLHVLMELGESFLAQQVYDANALHQANYLLEIVHEKQLEILYKSSTNSALLQLKKQLNKPGSYYFYLYDMERKRYAIENFEGIRVEKGNIEKINLLDINRHLDVFYIAEKLKVYCSILSWRNLINIDARLLFIDDIIKLASTEPYSTFPPIAIYYQILLTQTEFENEEHFFRLKELIKLHIHLFPPKEAKDIMDSAINYAIQKHNKGKLEFLRQNLDLYQDALVKEVIFINGEITPWTFKNIVTIALRLNEFEWVESFIENYQHKLNNKFKGNAINYNKAVLYFYKKEYDRVLPLLQMVQLDEINYGLDSRTLLLASYFELKEVEVLYTYIETFKAWLRRSKSFIAGKRDRYMELLNYTKKLFDLKGKDENNLIKLRLSIQNSNPASKKWLLEKVDELIEK